MLSGARHATLHVMPQTIPLAPDGSPDTGSRPRVVIAGAGVAAVEAVLALRHLAGTHAAIELLAPDAGFVNRPASVAVPFGFGAPAALDLAALATSQGIGLRHGELAAVDPAARVIRTTSGNVLPFDKLLVAVGARPVRALPGAKVFRGPGDAAMIAALLDEAVAGSVRHIAFAIPPETSWPLPAYELAVMTAIELRSRGAADVRLTVVTPEPAPLALFGPAAGDALRELLGARGIALRTGARPAEVRFGALTLDGGDSLATDAVVSLPALTGPHLPGLPADDRGFLPTDAHGRVAGVAGVFAAGDATTFPVKQGGLATQQADAAAATIAAELGAIAQPAPFAPVLRGLLLTGGAPLYLRAELDRAGGSRTAGARRLRSEASSRALWWPPGKIAGRYLAPYLATARPRALGREPLEDRAQRPGRPDASEREAALELALLLADEDAALGDFAQALHALDAAAALGGGVLPADYAERRERWRARIAGAQVLR
jgi:sulfide:quinone oxidoreductase